MENMLTAESLKLDNQARFILEKIDGKIILGTYIYDSVHAVFPTMRVESTF